MAKKKYKYTASEFRTLFGKKGKRTVRKSEDMEQAELCEWLKQNYPNVLYTVDLGGISLTPAQTKVHESRCKRGHPDFIIQEWFQDMYCGLALEFKKTGTVLNMKNIQSDEHLSEQWEYLQDLRDREYWAVFCCGLHNAKKLIEAYFEGTEYSLTVMNYFGFPKMKI